jgi:hypothetical protein
MGGMGSINPWGRMFRPSPHTAFLGPYKDCFWILSAVRCDSFRARQSLVLACLRRSRNDSLRGKSWEEPLSPAVRGADTGLPVSVHLSHRHPPHRWAHRNRPRSRISFMTANSLARASTSIVAVRFSQNLGKSLLST